MRPLHILLVGLVMLSTLGCQPEARRRLDRAEDLSFEGKHQEAMAEVERALKSLQGKESQEARALRKEALSTGGRLAHLFLRKPRVALEYYQALVEHYPDAEESFLARERMARIHLEDLGDRSRAIETWQALVASHPDNPTIDRFRYEIVKGYFTLGDYEQCRIEARIFLRKHPGSERADDVVFLVASSWQSAGEYDPAVENFRKVYTEYTNSDLAPRARVEEGNCLMAAGRDDEALEVFVRALATHPDPKMIQDKITRLRARIAARKPATGFQ